MPRRSARAAEQRPILIACVSDIHAGSTVSVCPPEGVRLDDGGTYHPSKPQLWLWECWEQYWARVDNWRRTTNADLWVVINGDAVEGDHHGTAQLVSRNPDAQNYVAHRVFGVPRDLRPERLFLVRGTEAHVGSSGSAEEALAKSLGAERDGETNTWSRWHLRLMAHGRLLDFQHHGRMGGRPWTQPGGLALLAFQIWTEHQLRGLRAPDLAVRSHLHRFGDSFGAFPTRVIQLPAWQLKTAHAHKVVPESIADVGGLMILVKPDGDITVVPDLSLPAQPVAI